MVAQTLQEDPKLIRLVLLYLYHLPRLLPPPLPVASCFNPQEVGLFHPYECVFITCHVSLVSSAGLLMNSSLRATSPTSSGQGLGRGTAGSLRMPSPSSLPSTGPLFGGGTLGLGQRPTCELHVH